MATFRVVQNNSSTDENTYKTIPASAIVGETESQVITNKTLDDSTTSIRNTTTATKLCKFDCSGISAATTRTLTVPNASGTIALTSDLPTTTSYAHASFQSNSTSSGNTLNDILYIQGTFANTYLHSTWTIAASNSFTYSGTSRYFKVTYMVTPVATSTNQTLVFTCYLNPDATTNPTGVHVTGSRTREVVNNQLLATQSTTGVFFVQLTTSDILRFYVQNTKSASDVTIEDASIRIESI